MESFQGLWEKDPVEAVSAFLKVRDVEHIVSPEVNEIGEKTKIHFRDFQDTLWIINAYNASHGYEPRLSIGRFNEEEPCLDLWDRLYTVGQQKLYHCTEEECLDMAFGLLADVENIVSGDFVPVANPYKAM